MFEVTKNGTTTRWQVVEILKEEEQEKELIQPINHHTVWLD